MYVYTRMCVCMWVYPCMYARVACLYGYMCIMGVCWFPFLFVCLVACYSISDSFVRSESVTGDSDPIWIRNHYGPDTQAIREPIHGMIRRSVPVHVVKTRQRFSFETMSFHVSDYSCIIFFIYHYQYYIHVTCIISCDCLRYFTSMITCITSWGISERSPYLCSWYERFISILHM